MNHHLVFPIVVASSLFGVALSQTVKSDRAPFNITIKASGESFSAGTAIYLELKVLNQSTETMVAASGFQTYDGDPSYEYTCHDSSGKSVSKEMRMVGSIHDPPSIKPGETYTSTVFLSRVCDLSRPGRYEIQLFRGIPIGRHNHVVKSNKITITVVP